MRKNNSALVIGLVVLSIVVPTVSSTVLQTQTEDQKAAPDDSKKEEPNEDTTPPTVAIENLPGGDGTDCNPGQWDVSAFDKESGINEDAIEVYIDGDLIGESLGIYDVPSSLGDHTIEVEVMNDNSENPLSGSASNTVSIIDDDITPPDLSDLIIEPTFEYVIISLVAIDCSGIGNFTILINEEVITPINVEENENHFTIVLENNWNFESGTKSVEIQVKDADNDRENDDLSSSIFGSFETCLVAEFQLVIGKIEELKNFIDTNIESHYKYYLICKLSYAQNKLYDALTYFEEGEITCSLFYYFKAKFYISIVEFNLKRIDCIPEEDSYFIVNELHIIRNCIVNLMGSSLGDEFGSGIANIEISLLNLADYCQYSIEGWFRKYLSEKIRFATFKLDWALILVSMGVNPTYFLDRTQSQLLQVISYVDYLLSRGRISQNEAEYIRDILLQSVEDVEILK
ncbi:MAG: hypothetical protein ACFFG0_08465 [Candidatus Thorarchaeota archaeon]